MQKVALTFRKPQKYIVLSVATADGQDDLLWGDPNAKWHNDILKKVQAGGHEILNVHGGGRIFVDTDTRRIFIWGTSDRYGLAPRYLVEEILEGEFPDYTLSFTTEPQ